MINGHCECGQIRYEVDGDILDFCHCHCSQCRRLHGAAYATFAGIARDRFRYVSGMQHVKAYKASEHSDRIFCGVCGSAMLVESRRHPNYLFLSMSTVAGNPPRPRAYHQYAASRAPWHAINDDLEQYPAAPPRR